MLRITRILLAALAAAGVLLVLGVKLMQPLSDPSVPDQVAGAQYTADQMSMLTGTVAGYQLDNGSITVAISGTNVLTQATFLSSYFPNVGDQVVLLRSGASWVVLGAMGNTQSRLVPRSGVVTASANYTAQTYGDPSGSAGPSTTAIIGTSGTALVIISSTGTINATGAIGFIGVRVDGPDGSVIAPNDNNALAFFAVGSNPFTGEMSYVAPISGITPGLNTFTLKYKCAAAGGTFTVGGRLIAVIPY